MIAFAGSLELADTNVDPARLHRLAAVAPGTAGPPTSWIGGPVGFAYAPIAGAPERPAGDPVAAAPGLGAVIFAGRLDNRAELRHLLGQQGPDAGAPDAVYVAAAYRRWGDAAPDHLVGDFAFGVWDEVRRHLLLARDPLGAVRLFYARTPERLLFASTVDQLLLGGDISREIDEDVFLWYLYAGHPRPTSRTFFRHVSFLPGGHRLLASGGTCHVEAYHAWPSDPPARLLPPAEAAEEFRSVFNEAVRCRLRGAESVAVLVSGGLDSSAVACVAGALPEAGRPSVRLYSMVFDELAEMDERRFSNAVAASAGLPHVALAADHRWALSHLDHWHPVASEPFMGVSDSALHMALSRAREEGVQRVLFGHGADHLTAGSPAYLSDWLLRGRWRDLNRQVRHQAAVTGRPYLRRLAISALYPLAPPWAQRAFENRQAGPARRWIPPTLGERYQAGRQGKTQTGRHAWWHSIREGIAGFGQLPLSGHERLVRSVGLEQANPFLDVRLAELVLRTRPDALYRDGMTKMLLRDGLRDLLPPTVRERSDKTLMTGLLHRGLRERLSEFVRGLLEDSELERRGYVIGAEWKEMVRGYLAGDDALMTQSWVTLTAEMWLRAQEGRLRAPEERAAPSLSTG